MFSWSRRATKLHQWALASVDRRANSVPTAVVVSASQSWDGNDGPWSSFYLRVGSPPQGVNVFISTASEQTWFIRSPDGCRLAPDPTRCISGRGGLVSVNESTTWVKNNFTSTGVFDLGIESNLNYSGTGRYGYDTVALGVLGGGGPSLDQQVVAAVADTSFWLGAFGLSPAASNFTDLNHPIPSYMANLKGSGQIPSISYGYTAGNRYRLNGVFGSLTLGGYDASKFQPNDMTWTFNEDVNRDLVVNVASIWASTGSTNITLSSTSFAAFIDSTIPYFYLPADVCRQFEQVFGLTYDSKSQLYLVNDTLRASLRAQAPMVTFSLANLTSSERVNITLPYDAFDLKASWPLVTNDTAYFPLRQAVDETQTTLGRAFLQEAYLIADYERSSFSVSNCAWNAAAKQDIRTILPPSNSSGATDSTANGGSETHFPVGAIVGTSCAVLVALILGVFFYMRWRRKRNPVTASRIRESPSDRSLVARHELDGTNSIGFIELPTKPTKPAEILELEEQFPARYMTDEISPAIDINMIPPKNGQMAGDVSRPPPDKTIRPAELEATVPRTPRTPQSEKFETFEDNRKYRF